MLTDVDIRQAIEFECRDHPVLSIYLNVDPHRRTPEKYKLALRNLLAQADGADAEDKQRIQAHVETGYNWQGRGLIMFSCAARDFWWVQNIPVGVEDMVFVSHRPYVHQLARLLDIYERLGVIHVDQVGARLYAFHMGNLEAMEGHLGEEVHAHKAGGWSAPRFQRREAETARQNLQEAAELAETFYTANDTRRLVLAGTDKNVAQFRSLLAPALRAMIIGEIPADTNASPNQIQEQVWALARRAADQQGDDLANRIITLAHKGGAAVLGLADTLNAVQTGRAQHVVVLADYSQPAYRFADSQHVVLDAGAAAAFGSSEELEELPDAVDSVLRRSLLQDIHVTVLEKHAQLEQAGKIGALTRY